MRHQGIFHSKVENVQAGLIVQNNLLFKGFTDHVFIIVSYIQALLEEHVMFTLLVHVTILQVFFSVIDIAGALDFCVTTWLPCYQFLCVILFYSCIVHRDRFCIMFSRSDHVLWILMYINCHIIDAFFSADIMSLYITSVQWRKLKLSNHHHMYYCFSMSFATLIFYGSDENCKQIFTKAL